MRFSSYLIGLAIISFVFLIFYGFTGDLASGNVYSINLEEKYKENFTNLYNISKQVTDDFEIVGNMTVNKDSFLGLSSDTVSLVKNMLFTPIKVTIAVINGIEVHLGVPSYVSAFLLTVIITLVIFSLISLVQKYRYA